MKLICKITDEDLGFSKIRFNNPRHRYAARGLVFNKEGQIAILNKSKKNEFKLVGGGIEKSEKGETAFKREVLEETGCQIEIDKFLGICEEEKSLDNFKQTSYVYVAHVTNNTNSQHFTYKEQYEGSKLIWCDINEAMRLIQESTNKLLPSNLDGPYSVYHTKFVIKRDYEILKYYVENIIK